MHEPHHEQPDHDLLFVTGLGRSGTSALTRVLASHPRILLGIERYKRLWRPARIDELDSSLFTRERFFDFSDGLTNLTPEADPQRWATHYDAMADKWDSAAYVGDKLTVLPFQALWRSMPDTRVVCIIREITEVASSWQTRATRAGDPGWPADRDGRHAVGRWNEANEAIQWALDNRPEQFCLVEYRSFFGDPRATALREALDWLGLDFSPAIASVFDTHHREYVDIIADKDRTLPPDVTAYIAESADHQLFHSLRRAALGRAEA